MPEVLWLVKAWKASSGIEAGGVGGCLETVGASCAPSGAGFVQSGFGVLSAEAVAAARRRGLYS